MTRLMRGLPTIDVCPDTAAIRVPSSMCSCSGGDYSDYSLWIRRIGHCGWLASYPIFDVLPGGLLDIRFDTNLWLAKPGLYEVVFGNEQEIMHNCCCAWPFHQYLNHPNHEDHLWRHPYGDVYSDGTVHSFQSYNSHRCHPRSHHGQGEHGNGFWYGHLLGHQEYLIHHTHDEHTHTHSYWYEHCYPLNHQHTHNQHDGCYRAPVAYIRLSESKPDWSSIETKKIEIKDVECVIDAPEGRDPMFDHLIDICANTTAVLEKGGTIIPLDNDTKDLICGTTLCRSVEFELYDGVNSEIVTFSACTSDGVVVERGSPSYKFPQGAYFRFKWTQNNVTASMEGCP